MATDPLAVPPLSQSTLNKYERERQYIADTPPLIVKVRERKHGVTRLGYVRFVPAHDAQVASMNMRTMRISKTRTVREPDRFLVNGAAGSFTVEKRLLHTRVRRPKAATLRKLARLDARIAELSAQKRALLDAAFEEGGKIDPDRLVKAAEVNAEVAKGEFRTDRRPKL